MSFQKHQILEYLTEDYLFLIYQDGISLFGNLKDNSRASPES